MKITGNDGKTAYMQALGDIKLTEVDWIIADLLRRELLCFAPDTGRLYTTDLGNLYIHEFKTIH